MIKTNDETMMWIDLASEKADDIRYRVGEGIGNCLTPANVDLLADQAWARTIFNEWHDPNSETYHKVFDGNVQKADESIYFKDIVTWLRQRVNEGMGRRYELALGLLRA